MGECAASFATGKPLIAPEYINYFESLKFYSQLKLSSKIRQEKAEVTVHADEVSLCLMSSPMELIRKRKN